MPLRNFHPVNDRGSSALNGKVYAVPLNTLLPIAEIGLSTLIVWNFPASPAGISTSSPLSLEPTPMTKRLPGASVVAQDVADFRRAKYVTGSPWASG